MSATSEFFDSLAHRGHEPLLEKATGTVRFELANDGRPERWVVAIDKGDLTVSRGNGAADCTIRADRKEFDRVASGEENAMAAVLRGSLQMEGSWPLLVLFRRVFPAAETSAA